MDVWKDHQAEASKVTGALKRRIESIAQRKNRVVDAYLHEGKIDHTTYHDQLDRLREEHALAETELNEARVEELDIEAVVNFSADAIDDASRFWICINARPKATVSKGIVSKRSYVRRREIWNPRNLFSFKLLA